MGSSTVTYRNQKFDAADATLEIWLLLLIDAIDAMPVPPAWLGEVREEWYLHATQAFGFGVVPGLDWAAPDNERRDVILDLCGTAIQRLQNWGPLMTREELDHITRENVGGYFTGDLDAKIFIKCADYFIKLLHQSLKPDELDARF
ncbi:MAG: hypothetical protein ABI411_04110 [Tahibacter sp.]